MSGIEGTTTGALPAYNQEEVGKAPNQRGSRSKRGCCATRHGGDTTNQSGGSGPSPQQPTLHKCQWFQGGLKCTTVACGGPLVETGCAHGASCLARLFTAALLFAEAPALGPQPKRETSRRAGRKPGLHVTRKRNTAPYLATSTAVGRSMPTHRVKRLRREQRGRGGVSHTAINNHNSGAPNGQTACWRLGLKSGD